MSFCENIQYLRKQEEMTQETLAEKLSVSRQSVSKWESGVSYPEMDKLIAMCDMFGCDLDTLVRGTISEKHEEAVVSKEPVYVLEKKEKPDQWQSEDTHKDFIDYCGVMTKTRTGITTGVCLCIIGATFMNYGEWLMDGFTSVIFFSMIAVAVSIFIKSGMALSHFYTEHEYIIDYFTPEQKRQSVKKFTARISAGVVILILNLITIELGEIYPQYGLLSETLFLLIVSVGVGIIVYGSLERSMFNLVSYNESIKAEKQNEESGCNEDGVPKAVEDAVQLVIWSIAISLFFATGFSTDKWDTNWIIFPITAMISWGSHGVLSLIYNLKKR